MSGDLVWYLIRNNNAFMVKRVPRGPIFSTEPGNLRNIHSHKYSGLANAKAFDVKPTPSSINISTRSPTASSHVVKKSRHSTTIRHRSGPRRAARVAVNIIKSQAKGGYRPDLRKDLLARIIATQQLQLEKKPSPAKKLRGKKKAAVAI